MSLFMHLHRDYKRIFLYPPDEWHRCVLRMFHKKSQSPVFFT